MDLKVLLESVYIFETQISDQGDGKNIDTTGVFKDSIYS